MEDIELKETPKRNYNKEFEDDDDDEEDGLMETNVDDFDSNLTRYAFENEDRLTLEIKLVLNFKQEMCNFYYVINYYSKMNVQIQNL